MFPPVQASWFCASCLTTLVLTAPAEAAIARGPAAEPTNPTPPSLPDSPSGVAVGAPAPTGTTDAGAVTPAPAPASPQTAAPSPGAQPPQTSPTAPATPAPVPPSSAEAPAATPTAPATAPPATETVEPPANEPLLAPSTAPESQTNAAPRPVNRTTEGQRPTQDKSGVSRDEMLRRYYRRLYRPNHNPARLTSRARIVVGGIGASEQTQGGRVIGITGDTGVQWNVIGAHLQLQALFGSFWIVSNDRSKTTGQTRAERPANLRSRALLGAGPQLSLGRLGHTGKGFIDPRVAYNFMYTRTGAPVDPADSKSMHALMHGPEFRVDMGFFFHNTLDRRQRQSLGVSVGWQMLIGTDIGSVPTAHLITLGIGYTAG